MKSGEGIFILTQSLGLLSLRSRGLLGFGGGLNQVGKCARIPDRQVR